MKQEDTTPRKGFNPFADLIGLEITDAKKGFSRCELNATPELCNPNKVLHGGVLFSMADTGMGVALHMGLDRGQHCATIEIKIAYFRPVTDGRLVCESRVIQQGRRFAFLESEITNGERLVAKATGTFVINGTA
jgi:acyl-CoA thioesterase